MRSAAQNHLCSWDGVFLPVMQLADRLTQLLTPDYFTGLVPPQPSCIKRGEMALWQISHWYWSQ